MTKAIIISRYNEDTSWTSKFNSDCKLYIYDKGISKEDTYECLENFGREAHTYLNHIIKHYNNLEDHNFFLQGDTPIHCVFENTCPGGIFEFVNNFKEGNNYKGLAGPEFPITGTSIPGHMHGILADNQTPTYFYDNFLKKDSNTIKDITYNVVACACFYVNKENILRHPLSVYQSIQEQFEQYGKSGIRHHDDLHFAGTLEYSWHLLFDNIYYQ
jgi:hypothetical protein